MSPELVKQVRLLVEAAPWVVGLAMVGGAVLGLAWLVDKIWYHRTRRKQNGTPPTVRVAGLDELLELTRGLEAGHAEIKNDLELQNTKHDGQHALIISKIEGIVS